MYDHKLTPKYLGFGSSEAGQVVIADILLVCTPQQHCYVQKYGNTYPATLDWVIAHEVEHYMGEDHAEGTDDLHTPHSQLCGFE